MHAIIKQMWTSLRPAMHALPNYQAVVTLYTSLLVAILSFMVQQDIEYEILADEHTSHTSAQLSRRTVSVNTVELQTSWCGGMVYPR